MVSRTLLSSLALALLALPASSAPTRKKPAARPAVRKPAAKGPAAPALSPLAKDAVSLTLEPGSIQLEGPRSLQHLVVTAQLKDGATLDVSETATYTLANPKLAKVEAGLLKPVADGETQLTAKLGSLAARPVTVKVVGAATPRSVEWVNDIMPILAKTGCNSTACHGSPVGKGGFKLSLFGYEPEADWQAVVKDANGKRVDPKSPEASLLLQKATGSTPHAGGIRFKKGSREYYAFLTWLQEGAPGIGEFEARVRSVEVFPGSPLLPSPTAKQRLAVVATMTDGSTRDVTDKVLFSSNDDALADVDESGHVQAKRQGETAVMVRYLGQVAVSRVAVLPTVKPEYPSQPAVNYVDEKVQAKLKSLRLVQSDLCTDEEFIRRLSLDTRGIIPTADEVRDFLADRTPDKRKRLIETYLDSTEFVDLWTLKWNDILRNEPQTVRTGVGPYYTWIRKQIETNRPYDEWVRELLTATGKNNDMTLTVEQLPEEFRNRPGVGFQLSQANRVPFNPATNYFTVSRDPLDATSATSQVFLGVRIECARCHNHPFEKWTQSDYFGLAAFFNGVQVRGGQAFFPATVLMNPRASSLRHPKTNEVVEPMLLDGTIPQLGRFQDPRSVMAQWLTSPQNPWFAKALANRLWAFYFGRGIVDPVDDFRVTNPASNPELLDALAEDLVRSRFDVKAVHRSILNSRTYQSSSKPNQYNRSDTTNFARYYPKRMMAEQLFDSISQATGEFQPLIPPQLRRLAAQPGNAMQIGQLILKSTLDALPEGPVTRVTQIPGPRVQGRPGLFLDAFGKPKRQAVCECERSSDGNVTQALALMNGQEVNRKIAAPFGRVARLGGGARPDAEVVEELYLAALSRRPTPTETDEAIQLLKTAPTRREGAEDLMWSLLNSREFLFNH